MLPHASLGRWPMTQTRLTVIAVLSLISGISGLVYETLWIRVISLAVGSTSAAMSIVLSIFFLGLSVGSFVAGRIVLRVKRPLLVYGLIEGVLGVYGALAIFPLFKLHRLVALLPLTGTYAWFGTGGKFALVFLLLIIPTTCMGMTLPFLVRAVVTRDDQVGRFVSFLYAVNTLGAVAGALATGFLLIPGVGILIANCSAALLNLVVCLSAVGLGRRCLIETARKSDGTFAFRLLSPADQALLLSCGLCGFVSITCEVAWSKYLSIFLGTNIFGLGLVLAMFLLGIAVGSMVLASVINRIRDQRSGFAGLLLASAAFVLLASYLLDEAPRMAVLVRSWIGDSVTFLAIKSTVVALILFLPACVFGALFPLGVSILTRSHEQAASTLGWAYAVNTVGSIIGSYSAGMVMIPHLGSAWTLAIAAIVAAGNCVWLSTTREGRGPRQWLAVTAGLVVAVGALVFHQFNFRNLIKSAYHVGAVATAVRPAIRSASDSRLSLDEALKPYSAEYEDFKVVIEGETGIISLSHDRNDGESYRDYLRLKTNGLNESIYNLANLGLLPKYEALIGLLPYLFSRDPKTAFVVGYGGGFTVDLLTETDLRMVHVAELEKGIFKAADFVWQGNNPIVKRKNLQVKIEDARFVLVSGQLGPQDIIVSQPSHSWLSGAANLFTREFFEIVKENLTEKGIYSQWLNLYNMDVPVLKSLLRTFFTVFPYGAVFTEVGDDELVLLGSKSPLQMSLPKLRAVSNNGILRSKLGAVFVQSAYDVLSVFSLSRTDVVPMVSDAVINTDVNAFAEVAQSRLFYEGLRGRQTPQAYLSNLFRADYGSILKVTGSKEPAFYFNLLLSLNDKGVTDKFPVVLREYEKEGGDQSGEWWNLGYFCLKAGRFASAEDYLSRAIDIQRKSGVLNLLLSALAEQDRYQDLIAYGERFRDLRNKVTDCYLGHAYVEMNRRSDAERLFTRMVADVPGYTRECGDYFNKVTGYYYHSKKQYSPSIAFLVAYYDKFPQDVGTVEKLLSAYEAVADKGNADVFREYLAELRQREIERLRSQASVHRAAGLDKDARVLQARAERQQKAASRS